MSKAGSPMLWPDSWRVRLATVAVALAAGMAPGQEGSKAPPADGPATLPQPTPPAVPAGRPTYPINLPTALRLANANPLDIAVAVERLRVATARYERARVLWLPTINLGVDYFRHDGRLQDVEGHVFSTSKSSFFVGGGPSASVAVSEAIYAPLAARQVVSARQADVQAAVNDSTLAVAEAYIDVQQARGELAGAADTVRRAEDLVRRAEQLAPGLTPSVEINRARTELARRRQAVEGAAERWEVASAELVRLLRLDPSTVVEPTEDPHTRVELIDPAATPDELIPLALTYRPELAAQQALVQATLARIRQEKLRPLVPSVILRGVGSATPGLSSGYFGGGINDRVGNFGGRNSVDVQAVWELENLGFGNRARVRERQAENRQALAELFQIQDRVAAEVVRALSQVKRSANRVREAEDGVRNAVETAEKNLQGLGQTRRVGEQLALVFRPHEAVAAVAALDQAYRDYYAAVGDLNRAQFRLYRAVGHPAQSLTRSVQPAGGNPPPVVSPGPSPR